MSELMSMAQAMAEIERLNKALHWVTFMSSTVLPLSRIMELVNAGTLVATPPPHRSVNPPKTRPRSHHTPQSDELVWFHTPPHIKKLVANQKARLNVLQSALVRDLNKGTWSTNTFSVEFDEALEGETK